MAARQQNSAVIDLPGRCANRIKVGAELGDQFAAAGGAGGLIRVFGDFGVTLAAELTHKPRINRASDSPKGLGDERRGL
jgi:hypothetical protein